MADISDVLRRIELLEGAMGGLYRWYADAFADDRDASALFARLAEEEGGHGDLARFQKNLVAKNRSLFGPVDADTDGIDLVVRDVAVFRESTSRPQLSEALIFAMQVEKSAAEHHCRTAMLEANPDLAGFVATLSKGDQDHFESLRELALSRNVGLPPELREALAL